MQNDIFSFRCILLNVISSDFKSSYFIYLVYILKLVLKISDLINTYL